jgi:Fe-S cluster biogenesis protein NfuA
MSKDNQISLQEIEKIITEKIKPGVQSHGGDIAVVSYKDDILTVKLSGACVGCPIAFYTLKMGVLQTFPTIKDVISV